MHFAFEIAYFNSSVTLYKIMKQTENQTNFRRSKRNFSDLNSQPANIRLVEDPYEAEKLANPKRNSIKINKNRLPPDFFPRTESLRKKVFSTRPSIEEGKNYIKSIYRKAQSQKNDFSPDKTSFFGFFEDYGKTKKNLANNFNTRREFESRDQPKREKMYMEQRNLTPMTGSHRIDLLEMFPATYDQAGFDVLSSKKLKDFQPSPKKTKTSRQKDEDKETLDPEAVEDKKGAKQMSKSRKQESGQDMNNITFFNAKSTSFPPIYKLGNKI